MDRVPRPVLWVVLVAMLAVVVSQIGTGFHRPVQVAAGGLAAGMAVFAAIALWRARNKSRS